MLAKCFGGACLSCDNATPLRQPLQVGAMRYTAGILHVPYIFKQRPSA